MWPWSACSPSAEQTSARQTEAHLTITVLARLAGARAGSKMGLLSEDVAMVGVLGAFCGTDQARQTRRAPGAQTAVMGATFARQGAEGVTARKARGVRAGTRAEACSVCISVVGAVIAACGTDEARQTIARGPGGVDPWLRAMIQQRASPMDLKQQYNTLGAELPDI